MERSIKKNFKKYNTRILGFNILKKKCNGTQVNWKSYGNSYNKEIAKSDVVKDIIKYKMSQHIPETHSQFNVQTKLVLASFEFKEVTGVDT